MSKPKPPTKNTKKTASKPPTKAKNDSSDSDSYSENINTGSVRGTIKPKAVQSQKSNQATSKKVTAKPQKPSAKKLRNDDEYSDESDSDEKPKPVKTKKSISKPPQKPAKRQLSDSNSDEKPSKSKPIQSQKTLNIKSTKKPVKKPPSESSESDSEEDSYEESEDEKPKPTKRKTVQSKKPPPKTVTKTANQNGKSKSKKTIGKTTKTTRKSSSSDDYNEYEEEDYSESSEPIKKKSTTTKQSKKEQPKPTKKPLIKKQVNQYSSSSDESSDDDTKQEPKKIEIPKIDDSSEIASYNLQTEETTTTAVSYEATELTTSNVSSKGFGFSLSSEFSEKQESSNKTSKRKRRSRKKRNEDPNIIYDEFGRAMKVVKRLVIIKNEPAKPEEGASTKVEETPEDTISAQEKRQKLLEEEETAKRIIATNELTVANLKLKKELEQVKTQKIINYYSNIDSILAEEIKQLKSSHRQKCQRYQKLYNYDTQRKYETSIENNKNITTKLNELITAYNEKTNPQLDKINRIQLKYENISRNSLILVAKNIREMRLSIIKEKQNFIDALSTKVTDLHGIHFDTQDNVQRIEKEIKKELKRRDDQMYNIFGKVLDRQQIKLSEKIQKKKQVREQSQNRGIRYQTYQDRFDNIIVKAGYDMKKNLYMSDALQHYEQKLIKEKKLTEKAHYNLRVQTDKLESLKKGKGEYGIIETRGEVKKTFDEYNAKIETSKKKLLEMRKQIVRHNELNKLRDKKAGELHIELSMLYSDEETEDMLIKIKQTVDFINQLLEGITKIDKKFGGVQNEQIEATERYESMRCTAERMMLGYNKNEVEKVGDNPRKAMAKVINAHREFRQLLDDHFTEESITNEFELIEDDDNDTNIFDFKETEKHVEEEEEEDQLEAATPAGAPQ